MIVVKQLHYYMNKAKLVISKYRISVSGLFLSLFLFLTTFFGDRIAFIGGSNYRGVLFYILVKICVLCFLVYIVQIFIYCIKAFRAKNHNVIWFVYFFMITFAVALAAWAVCYPGIIGVDEANVVNAARHLDVLASWHNVMTNFYYAFALGIFPSLAMITLIQVLISSAVIAYIASCVRIDYGKSWAWAAVLLLLLPQVLTSNITPHRITLSAVLELMLLFMLWRYYYSDKAKTRGGAALITMGLLTGLISAWRTEAIIYLIAIPVCLWLLAENRKLALKKSSLVALLSLLVFIPITVVQNLNTKLMLEYQVTGLFAPIASVVRGGDYISSDKTYVKNTIDKAIDYDSLVEGKDPNATYWSREDHSISKEDLSSLKKLTIKLIIQNPTRYITGSLMNFTKSGLIIEDSRKIVPTLDMRFSEGLLMSTPMNEVLRTLALSYLKGTTLPIVHNIFYANPLVVLIMILASFVLIIKRRLIAIIFVAVLAKTSIIFLTVPMPSYLYYYPAALTGSVLIMLLCAQCYKERQTYLLSVNTKRP